jgi:hypothetical protein
MRQARSSSRARLWCGWRMQAGCPWVWNSAGLYIYIRVM